MEVLNRGMGDDFIKPEHSGVEGQEKQTKKEEEKKKSPKKSAETRQIISHSNHGTNRVDFYFFPWEQVSARATFL